MARSETSTSLVTTVGVGCATTLFIVATSVCAAENSSTTIQFGAIAVPSVEQVDRVMTAPTLLIGGRPHPLGYHALATTGQEISGEIFGVVKNIKNQPVRDERGEPFICRTLEQRGAGPDFTSLIRYEGGLFATTQFECAPGAVYVAKLDQSPSTGLLTPSALRYADASNVRGGMLHCGGTVTPWGTHLGSEEYEPDAATLDEKTMTVAGPLPTFNGMGSYFGEQRDTNPYDYGWITQIRLTSAKGNSEMNKEWAMGRFSHELAYGMPDQKTYYMTDDGTNGGFFMFIADKPADLSAGRLYAARWMQRSTDRAGSADLRWIDLGHGRADEIKEFVSRKPTFADLFDKTEPLADARCPDSFTSVNTTGGHECLRLRPGMARYVSRLETRRYAAWRGATTEFRKAEGLAYSEKRNMLYLAMSEIDAGMLNDIKRDRGGENHIQLRKNSCGAVYELALADAVKDSADIVIASNYVAVSMDTLLQGEYGADKSAGKKSTCSADAIANPDNVVYLPEADALIIAEDSDMHEVNMLWAYELEKRNLKRILTAPRYAEITSLGWYSDINGWAYLTAVIQHPFVKGAEHWREMSAEERSKAESTVGYLGPFPLGRRANSP